MSFHKFREQQAIFAKFGICFGPFRHMLANFGNNLVNLRFYYRQVSIKFFKIQPRMNNQLTVERNFSMLTGCLPDAPMNVTNNGSVAAYHIVVR